MKRLDRYIFVEVAAPFLAAQLIFIVLFLSTEALTEATKLISRYGLPWWGVLKLLFLRMPWAIGWTMPMATGMAVILAVGRLCRDTEYTAMVVGGMSFKRILIPMLVFAALVTSFAVWVQEYLGPASMMAYHKDKLTLQNSASAEVLELHLRLNSYEEKRRVTLTAESLDAKTRTIRGLTINVTEDGNELYRISAQKALWSPDSRHWTLYNGFTETSGKQGQPLRFHFAESDVSRAAGLAGYGGDIVFEGSPNQIEIASTDKPDYLPYGAIRQRIRWMVDHGFTQRETGRVRVYLHKRWTLATSCFLFVLIGAPLAVRPDRGAKLGGAFALAICLILTYYIIWNATSFLGEAQPQPWMWAWSSNIAGLLLGLFMVRRVRD